MTKPNLATELANNLSIAKHEAHVLRERVKELEAALRPFAEYAGHIAADADGERVLVTSGYVAFNPEDGSGIVRIRHLRRAAKALAGSEGQ